VYLCVGTVVAQAAAIAFVVATNTLSRDQMYEMLAAAYGVDVEEVDATQTVDTRLEELHVDVDQDAFLGVQQTFTNIQPRQAKEQLLSMLEEQDAMSDVVAIIEAIPADRRTEILEEFSTPEELVRLAEILRQMRLAHPETPVADGYQPMLDGLTSEK
jgi:hypothetical protein